MPGTTIYDPPRLTTALVNVNTIGSNIIIPAKPGQYIRIYKLWLVAAAAVNVTISDVGPPPGNIIINDGPMPFLPSGALILDYDTIAWYNSQVGASYALILSAAVQVSGRIYYTQT